MKAFYFALIICGIAVGTPVSAADKESPFNIEKRDFKKKIKTIALAPVDASAQLQMPDSAGAMLEAEITKHLQKRGYTVIPSTVLAGIRKTMEEQVGGFEDAETGRANIEKMQAVRTHSIRELWFRHELDAIATIGVSASQVPLENDNAKWDGAKQTIEREGKRLNYTGQIVASSVSFAVYDQSDRVMYLNYGGLEALMMRDKEQLVPLPPESFFKDEKRIRKAAQIAVSPI